MDGYPYQQPVVQMKKRSFFSTLVLGLSAIVVTAIVSGSGILIYGMNIADRKTDNIAELIEEVATNLPQFVESLPPVLSDVFHDERRPEYAENLEVSVRLVTDHRRPDRVRPVVEVRNNGDRMVSLLSMRIVVQDADGNPIAEMTEWAATPIAADDNDWRGPLLPNAIRQFPVRTLRCRGLEADLADLKVTYEITDIRTWNKKTSDVDI